MRIDLSINRRVQQGEAQVLLMDICTRIEDSTQLFEVVLLESQSRR
ncbi:hypothetical protein [Streptomyces sp. NPDC058667]